MIASGSALRNEALLENAFLVHIEPVSPGPIDPPLALSIPNLRIVNMDSPVNKRVFSQCSSASRRSRSPRILSTVKDLVQRPTAKFVSQKAPGSARSKNAAFNHDDGANTVKSSRRAAQKAYSPPEMSWKRRGHTPEMDEYLTLTELESLWNKQDSCALCVYAPQNVTQYTFQEAVELPLIAKHELRPRSMESTRSEPVQRDHTPQITVQDDSSIVNGAVHPALRPSPHLSDDEIPTYKPLPPRLLISVPNTDWTYGRS